MTIERFAAKMTLIRLDDGREFPVFEGKPLSWSIGLYWTLNEQNIGYPRAKAVIAALREHRPDQLERERRDALKASFDPIFGHQARKLLALIESELEVVQ